MGEYIVAILIIAALVFVYISPYMIKDKVPDYNGEQIKCPRCGGTHYHVYIEEEVVLPRKVRGKTTLNMNPFKPFTVYNHEEEVVREAVTRKVSRFVCDKCGNIFG
ncbi:MAG: hypothetical protein IJA32_14650 [Lachnospiraceae bacterium]|nr:hypothetical protein [Lachnospiraceae bacterium]